MAFNKALIRLAVALLVTCQLKSFSEAKRTIQNPGQESLPTNNDTFHEGTRNHPNGTTKPPDSANDDVDIKLDAPIETSKSVALDDDLWVYPTQEKGALSETIIAEEDENYTSDPRRLEDTGPPLSSAPSQTSMLPFPSLVSDSSLPPISQSVNSESLLPSTTTLRSSEPSSVTASTSSSQPSSSNGECKLGDVTPRMQPSNLVS